MTLLTCRKILGSWTLLCSTKKKYLMYSQIKLHGLQIVLLLVVIERYRLQL